MNNVINRLTDDEELTNLFIDALQSLVNMKKEYRAQNDNFSNQMRGLIEQLQQQDETIKKLKDEKVEAVVIDEKKEE